MSRRSAKFVAALFVSVLAGADLATVTDLRTAQAATAPTTCLTAPKGATSAGSHWYYRIDRATKRQCWYLRDDSDKATSPPAPRRRFHRRRLRRQPRGAGRAAAASIHTRKAISDARAEWISQRSRAEPNSPAKVERAVAAVPAPAAQNSPRAAMPNVLAPAPLSSVRWNDAPTTTRTSLNSTDIQIAAANPPAAQPPQAEEVQQPAVDQIMPVAAANAGDGKADRIAAEAASGDGRSPRAGLASPAKRDRADRPHAGAPRHAPQALA